MLKSLAFVPADKVLKYFKKMEKKVTDESVKNVYRWFSKNYIDKQTRRYDPDFWTIIDNINENVPRTSNSAEAWHRRFKVIVGKKNTGVYKIIKALAKEIIMSKTTFNKLRTGQIIKKNRKSTKKNKQLKLVVGSRTDYKKKTQYLSAIAHHMSF